MIVVATQYRKRFLTLALFISTTLAAGALAACDTSASQSGTTAPPSGGTAGPLSGSATQGQAVFARYCNACHPGGGQGAGPSLLQRIPHMNDEEIKDTVRGGKGRMPPYSPAQISDSDLTGLIAYLRTLK